MCHPLLDGLWWRRRCRGPRRLQVQEPGRRRRSDRSGAASRRPARRKPGGHSPEAASLFEQNVGESVAGGLGSAASSPARALFSKSTTSAKDCLRRCRTAPGMLPGLVGHLPLYRRDLLVGEPVPQRIRRHGPSSGTRQRSHRAVAVMRRLIVGRAGLAARRHIPRIGCLGRLRADMHWPLRAAPLDESAGGSTGGRLVRSPVLLAELPPQQRPRRPRHAGGRQVLAAGDRRQWP